MEMNIEGKTKALTSLKTNADMLIYLERIYIFLLLFFVSLSIYGFVFYSEESQNL